MERRSNIDIKSITAAIEISIIKAYEGKISGSISAGSTGIIPIETPRGWLAPVRVFCKALNAIIQTVIRKTTEIPIKKVSIAMLAKNVNSLPITIPMAVFIMTAKVKRNVVNVKEAFI